MACAECGGADATHHTPSGRQLCDDCYRRLAQATGAAMGLSGNGSMVDGLVTGMATALRARHRLTASGASRPSP